MKDWSWLAAFRKGDDEAFSRSLADETDKSLAKDPGRWSWGKRVEETVDHPRPERGRRGGHTADRRHHTGKGHVEAGESRERGDWHPREWENAKADYERQNPPNRRGDRED